MFRVLILIAATFFSFSCAAMPDDKTNYAIHTIPAALLENANAVVRYDNLDIKVISEKEVYTVWKYAITILNEKGMRHAALHEEYDRFNKIEKIKGAIYDKEGKEIRKIKTSDVSDVKEFDYSFYDDNRVKEYKPGYSVFPFTIVYEVEQKLLSTFYIPDWYGIPGFGVSVENVSLNIEYPESLHLKHKVLNIDKPLSQSTDKGIQKMGCILEHIPAKEKDPLAQATTYPFPTILLSMKEIVLDGYKGDFDNWASFGHFFYDLNKDRDILPDEVKNKVHTLTDTCSTAYGKISLLYDYMKERTRYVSIQLGIGGWQTFPAAFVAEKGYGDCKALTNYLKALLKEAGIVAHEVLVSAGSNYSEMQPDFAANVFNHVILCVPLQRDSVWVECTAKDLPAGYLSSFTHGRNALLITANGGVVVKTPSYTHHENKLHRNIDLQVDSADGITGNIVLLYQGFFRDGELMHLDGKTKEHVNKHFNGKFELPHHNITSYSTKNIKYGYVPAINEDVQLRGTARISRSGKRVYLQPLITSFDVPFNSLPRERKTPFYISLSFEIADTTTVLVPGNYTADYMPGNISLINDFGSYHCTYTFEENRVKVIRTYMQKEGSYPADKYADFLKFIKAATYSGDGNKVALLKKD